MKIAVISGSMRTDSQSLKVAAWLQRHLQTLGAESQLHDLHALDLPMYSPDKEPNEAAVSFVKALETSDGAVFVSPEWNGTMSHGLVNAMHYVGAALAHKPVMLVGVSAGRGGHYPLMQMRIMQYKNSHFVVIPENVLVQGAKETMNSYEAKDSYDDPVEKRANYGLKVLLSYADALASVRQSGVIDREEFGSGV